MTDNVLTITIAGKTDDFDVSEFITVVRNTVAILRDLEAARSGAGNKLTWVVTSATKASPLKMRMAGIERGGGGGSYPVAAEFVQAMKHLEDGDKRPELFSDRMLDNAQKIVSPLNKGLNTVVFASEQGEPVAVSQHVAANVSRLRLPNAYSAFGEVEGFLGQITSHRSTNEFCIFDPLSDRKIPCSFEADELDEIRQYLRQRVRVSGLVTYKRDNDEPEFVDVDEWKAIPEDHLLPSIEELHRARINLTGGRKSEEVIAELRRVHA